MNVSTPPSDVVNVVASVVSAVTVAVVDSAVSAGVLLVDSGGGGFSVLLPSAETAVVDSVEDSSVATEEVIDSGNKDVVDSKDVGDSVVSCWGTMDSVAIDVDSIVVSNAGNSAAAAAAAVAENAVVVDSEVDSSKTVVANVVSIAGTVDDS
jgi:hypothetical protein